MEFLVRVPGSCGELLQGYRRDGSPFLVTCPIDRFASARVSDRCSDVVGLGEKAKQAFSLTLAQFGAKKFPYGLALTSDLPRGKGMASSSADIAAVAFAVAHALGQELTVEEALKLAVQIEPTDATFCPGVVALNQVTGEVFAHYENLPRFALAIFDTGGAVDTLARYAAQKHSDGQTAGKNSSVVPQSGQGKPQIEQDWESLLPALRGTPKEIAAAATWSALWNEMALKKPHFAELRNAAKKLGALGLVCAHSGTVLGFLFAPEDAAKAEQAARVVPKQIPVYSLGTARLLGENEPHLFFG